MKTTNIGASRILFLWSNIPALAAGKRAFRQLRLVCEPFRAQKMLKFAEQSKAHEQGLSLIDAPPQKTKKAPEGVPAIEQVRLRCLYWFGCENEL